MKLFYYKDPQGNFGDDLNEWLWEKLLPGIWNERHATTMSGIGTIIGKIMPPSKKWIVFSSGTGYGAAPSDFGDKSWDIISVRGPLTARVLKLPEDKAVTDGAILISLLPEYQPSNESERRGILFMPHHKALEEGRWKEVCQEVGVEFIDPRNDSKQTLDRVRSAKLVLADAMHAAIVADTVRVQWMPLIISAENNSFKWLDWTMSMGLPYVPMQLPASSLRENIKNKILTFFKAGYMVSDASTESALSHYHYLLTKRAKLRTRIASVLVQLSSSILKKIATSSVFGSTYKRYDDRQMQKAVVGMKGAINQQTFLSEEKFFVARKNEMQVRMEKLRALARHEDNNG